MKMRKVGALAIILWHVASAEAKTPQQIIAENARSTVYLEVTDDKGGVIERGSGVIVSHDGYFVTAAHVYPDNASKMWVVIGQREGTRYSADLRGKNDDADVAIFQIKQTATCHYSSTVASKKVAVPDRVIALGFPGSEGLTPSFLNITNTTSSLGFLKSDGFLQVGNSGGPVFDESGNVVAIVEGGVTTGAEANDLIPVSLALDLLRKRGADVGVDKPIPFDNACYAICRSPSHGVESWGVERDWPGTDADHPDGKQWSGEVPGGHNQSQECAALVSAAQVASPGSQITVPQDPSHMGEISQGSWPTLYNYWCRGTLRADPVYVEKQSPACGLWATPN